MINFNSVQSFQTGYEKRSRQLSMRWTNGCGLHAFSRPARWQKNTLSWVGGGQRPKVKKQQKYFCRLQFIDMTLNSSPLQIPKVAALNHQRRPAPEAHLLRRRHESASSQPKQNWLTKPAASALLIRTDADQT